MSNSSVRSFPTQWIALGVAVFICLGTFAETAHAVLPPEGHRAIPHIVLSQLRPSPLAGLSCTRDVLIGAPGSGQMFDSITASDDPDHLGPEIAPIYRSLQSNEATANEWSAYSLTHPMASGAAAYSASSVPSRFDALAWRQYTSAMISSAEPVASALIRISQLCPRSRLALVGYSQGAGVIHEALARLHVDSLHRGRTSTLYSDAAQLLSQTRSILLIADPYASADNQILAGSGNASSWTGGSGGIMELLRTLATDPPGKDPPPIEEFAKYLRSSRSTTLVRAAAQAACLLGQRVACDFRSDIGLIAGLEKSGALSSFGGLTADGYFTSTSRLRNELGVATVAVSHVGDIVADPLGTLYPPGRPSERHCRGFPLFCPSSPWFSVSVHASAYVNDPVLTSREMLFVERNM